MAQQQELPQSNEWEVPLGCPGRAWAERRVRVLAGERAQLEHGLPLGVRIEGSSARWRATLARTSASGTATRVLEGRSCRAVSDAAVVLLAWAVREDQQQAEQSAGGAPTVSDSPGESAVAGGAVATESTAAQAPSQQPTPERGPVATGVSSEGARVLAAPMESSGAANATGEPAASAEAATVTPVESPLPRRRSRRSATPVRNGYLIGITGGVELGPLPGASGSVALYGGFSRGNFRGEISFTARPGTTAELQRAAEGRTVGGRFRAFTGAVTGCYEHALRPVELGACASFEAGAVTAEGFGAVENSSRTEPWLAGRVDAELRVPIGGSFALRAAVGAVIAVVRPEYELTGIGPVFQPSVLGGRGALSAEVRF